LRTKETPTRFINGAEYHETYPWIEIEMIPNAGRLLLYQHCQMVIPRLAEAAKRAMT